MAAFDSVVEGAEIIPNVYELGGTPELRLNFYDIAGNEFIPIESRLSVEEPGGTVFTVSGADMTTASGYLYYLYRPLVIGWYEYKGWGMDGTGREVATANGFEVVEHLLNNQ
jgi:hypothetical protein